MLAGEGGRMAISREVVMPDSIKHARPKRFPVLIRGRWWPLLIPFGVTQERAFVQVGGRELRVCFGPLFGYRFPLGAVGTGAATPRPRRGAPPGGRGGRRRGGGGARAGPAGGPRPAAGLSGQRPGLTGPPPAL